MRGAHASSTGPRILVQTSERQRTSLSCVAKLAICDGVSAVSARARAIDRAMHPTAGPGRGSGRGGAHAHVINVLRVRRQPSVTVCGCGCFHQPITSRHRPARTAQSARARRPRHAHACALTRPVSASRSGECVTLCTRRTSACQAGRLRGEARGSHQRRNGVRGSGFDSASIQLSDQRMPCIRCSDASAIPQRQRAAP